MASFESGVKRYIVAEAKVRVYFPVSWKDEASIACVHCPHYRNTYRKCGLNDSIVNFPERYVGSECPLEEVVENV